MRCSRGYHIRIIVQRKAELSQSQPQAADSFIPSRLFQRLPAHRVRKKGPPVDQYSPQTKLSNRDYRFGPIRIDWVDFEDMSKAPFTLGKERETRGSTIVCFVTVQEPYARAGTLQAVFVPHTRSKSGTTNLPEGIVHVFRESATRNTSQKVEVVPPPSPSTTSEDSDSDGVLLGVLAVPAYMTPSDFLTFVAPAAQGMAHLRLIRDSAPNRSIAIIKFFNPADAAEFVEAYNGKPFNSMDPETCSVVHVLSVVIDTEDLVSQTLPQVGSPQSSINYWLNYRTMLSYLPLPVFEQMGRQPLSCLQILTDSSIISPHIFIRPLNLAHSVCQPFDAHSFLVFILYGRAHAHAHYQSTTHLYALELETQRVWDYAGDGYVHRLIQNKADGKLVELPSAASSAGVPPRDGSLGPTQADALSAEKIEAIGIEYSYLLTSQLESQRSYYEDEAKELKNQVTSYKEQVERLNQRLEEDAKRKNDEEQGRLANVLKEKNRADARAEKATELARRLDKELKEERAVSEGLMTKMNSMKEKVQRADADKGEGLAKIRELEEQMRDLMFFLETRMKIESGEGPEAELAGGSVEVSSPTDISRETKKKKSRKR
ncbi:hypothetical protein C0992_011728 [Termitomyces sp. T32_za158]|nr:hypothetical protein C0992_011728 [Termitomyces sp. T32_za158]